MYNTIAIAATKDTTISIEMDKSTVIIGNWKSPHLAGLFLCQMPYFENMKSVVHSSAAGRAAFFINTKPNAILNVSSPAARKAK